MSADWRREPVPTVFVDLKPTGARPRPRLRELVDLLKVPKIEEADAVDQLAAEVNQIANEAAEHQQTACSEEQACVAAMGEARELATRLDGHDRRAAALQLRSRCSQARTASAASTQASANTHRLAASGDARQAELTLLAPEYAGHDSLSTATSHAHESATQADVCASAAADALVDVEELDALATAVLDEIANQEKADQIAELGPCDEDGNRMLQLVSAVSPSSPSDRIQWFVDGVPFGPVQPPGTYSGKVPGDGEPHTVELAVISPVDADGDSVEMEFPTCDPVDVVGEIRGFDFGECDEEGFRPLRLVSAVSPSGNGDQVQWLLDGEPVGGVQSPGTFISKIAGDGASHRLELRVISPADASGDSTIVDIPACGPVEAGGAG